MVATNTVEVVQCGELHGVAPLVVAECRTVTHHEPSLTLLGLALVYEPNT